MSNHIQGPSERDIDTGKQIARIVTHLKEDFPSEETAAVKACVEPLEEFMWNYAGLVTGDGDEEACDRFLEGCGF